MWNRSAICLLVAVLLFAASRQADAHGWYGQALKRKYDFKIVTCYTCHLNSKEAAATMTDEEFEIYRAKSMRYLNEFGKQFVPVLPDSDVANEIDCLYLRRRRGSNGGRDDGMQKLKEQGQREFLDVLPQVEALRDPASGKTYGELLRNGKLDGIRLREEPMRMPSDY